MAAASIFSSQSNRETSEPLFIGVIAVIPQTGKTVFAQAKIIPQEDVISLVFQTSTKMLPEMQKAMQQSLTVKQDFEEFLVSTTKLDSVDSADQEWFYCFEDDLELLIEKTTERSQKIKRVLIHLELPYDLKQTNHEQAKLNGTLIYRIGCFCRQMFPNLDPRESAYNLHFGFSNYRTDTQLLPSATPSITFSEKI